MDLMKRFRSHRARRLPALLASLALFLLGSNYCVLTALTGGAPMACLTIGTDAASAAVPACHRSAATSDRDTGKPAARPSCCPDPVVAPASPVIDKADGTFTPLAHAVLATTTSPASPTAIDRHGQRPAHDGQPPPRFAHAPAPARAPPLA
jgi:hypothetical protein